MSPSYRETKSGIPAKKRVLKMCDSLSWVEYFTMRHRGIEEIELQKPQRERFDVVGTSKDFNAVDWVIVVLVVEEHSFFYADLLVGVANVQ